MELKFMTPSEVWENYDPSLAPLESSTIFAETDGNIVHSSFAFNVDHSEQISFAARMDVYFDNRWQDARSTVLLLPALDDIPLDNLISRLLLEGYAVGVADYSGKNGTDFPASLQFAKYSDCRPHMDILEGSARKSPWYVWSKIARRAITKLCELPVVDSQSVVVMGIGVGAHISWQVAAMDKRVKALVPICGGGYRWAKRKPRFESDNVPANEEEIAYSTGVGAETYAKFVTCPTFYLTTRMSQYCDVDRAGDILAFVKCENKKMLIMRSVDMQITEKALRAMLVWLRGSLAGQQNAVCPTMSFESADGELYLRLHTQHKAKHAQVYFSTGEASPFARHWIKLDGLQKVGTHEYTLHVPVYNPAALTVAYASLTYGDDDASSTPVIGVIPQQLGATNVEEGNECSRIIYDNSMDTDIFSVKTDDAVLASSLLGLATGPFDIDGVSVKDGALLLCRSEREITSFALTSTLHFDVYSPDRRELLIKLFTVPDEKCYMTRIQLVGGDFWQKIILYGSDFKSEEGRTLAKFANTKVMSFMDAHGLIFNNFLWI